MRLIFLCASFFLALAGCKESKDSEADKPFSAPEKDIEAYEKTVFTASKQEVGAKLGELGAPWNSLLGTSERPDSFSGGHSIRTLFSGGSHQVYLDQNDRVWRVRLNSGFSTKCGDKGKLIEAVKLLAPNLENGITVNPEEMEKAKEALETNSNYMVEAGSARIAFSGSCVSSALLSAQ